MSVFRVNTTEDFEYVEADRMSVDSEGVLYAYTAVGDEVSQAVAIWTSGFWLSVNNVEVEVDEPAQDPLS